MPKKKGLVARAMGESPHAAAHRVLVGMLELAVASPEVQADAAIHGLARFFLRHAESAVDRHPREVIRDIDALMNRLRARLSRTDRLTEFVAREVESNPSITTRELRAALIMESERPMRDRWVLSPGARRGTSVGGAPRPHGDIVWKERDNTQSKAPSSGLGQRLKRAKKNVS